MNMRSKCESIGGFAQNKLLLFKAADDEGVVSD
jgi:hypothetical protein